MTPPPAAGLFAYFVLPAVALAAAAAATAVPVLIHLLSRQRHQIVPWAAIRFLVAAQKRHRRHVDRWLLLAARLLALLLPLAGMAAVMPWAEDVWQSIRPGPPEVVSNAPRTHRILVVDASLSLTAKSGDRTRFEILREQAEKAVRSANPGDGFTLVLLTAMAQVVVPGPSADPDKVVEELHALRSTHGTGDLAGGVAAVADILTRSPRTYPRKQVLLFTDLQRSAWAGLLPRDDGSIPDVWHKVRARADVAVVDIAGGDTENLAVSALTLTDPLPFVGVPTAVTAAVENFGRTDRKRVRVELQLGRPSANGPETTMFPVEQRVIETIEAGKRVAVTFALEGPSRFTEAGTHLLRVRLVDADDLPADDTRSLAVEVRNGLNVLLVNGKPTADPKRRATEYLSEAFAPAGRKLAGNPVHPRTVGLSEFADPVLGDLAGVDCVILCDVPTLSAAQVARLEAHLKRGGGVVIGLGPTAAENIEQYNRVLYADGTGILPGKLLGTEPAGRDSRSTDPGFRLAAVDMAYRVPPLAVFADDRFRAGLTSVPFAKFLRLDAPEGGVARRVLSFTPADGAEDHDPRREAGTEPTPTPRPRTTDPAVVEWPRHRGRVVVFTSSFNRDWTEWPVLPTFLPFAHELLRFASANPDRHTARVGESLEEFLPANTVGLTATVTGPEGITYGVPVTAGDGAGVVRCADTTLSGLYRVSVGGRRSLFAVNVPDSAPGGGSESDLRRLDAATLTPLGKIPIVTDPTDTGLAVAEPSLVSLLPRPHGPTIARWLLAVGLLALIAELWLAWRLGPGRSGGTFPLDSQTMAETSRVRAMGWWGVRTVGVAAVLVVGMAIVTVAHAHATGEFLGFLPTHLRSPMEKAVGVPGAGPGEGTRWRLESSPAFLHTPLTDGRMLLVLGAVGLIAALLLYRRERRAAGRFTRLLLPLGLRVAAVLLVVWVLLPQLRLAFDREGWPDVAILLDTSASMATVDDLRDPTVRAKADALRAAAGITTADRIRLAKQLLTRPEGDLLTRLLTERQVKVHVYTVADRAKLVAEVSEPADVTAAKEAIGALPADGDSSRLGDGVQAVLKAFRGGSLAAIVAYTDGVTTAGDDLPHAGQEAARAGVPLFLIGLGDARDPADLIVSDLKADDVVLKGDTLVFEARVTVRGTGMPATVPVILYERDGETLTERARQTVSPDPSGKPVTVRFSHTPTEVGETTYVIDLPVQTGEAEPSNNRVERVVLVTEDRKLRVFYIEGYARYEFRFVKALLERETDAIAGNKTVELNTLLLDASQGYAEQDKSALRGLPTKSELFEYDVVVVGDVDPAELRQAGPFLPDLVEFVKVRGGGLLFVAGAHSLPHSLFDTPLAELLPVTPSRGEARHDPTPLTTGYLPKPTPFGLSHPLFRFTSDPVENARVWAELKPLLWVAQGYRRKESAEVLAVHPEHTADGFPGEAHPVVLQQFVGAGRVLFFGFDETWRWRFREGETRFNEFWHQTMKVLARGRVSRPELRTDKQTAYRRDEPIRLTVRFPDDAPAPAADVSIQVQVERSPLKLPGGSSGAGTPESQAVQLAKVDGTRATYQALLTRTPEGEYRFHLTDPPPPGGGSPPRAEAKVLPPPGERERLEMNRSDLARAASESRGKFYSLADADTVVDDLPDGARVPLNQPVPPVPLWNHAGVFGILVVLLGCEWLLRRRERLL